MAASLLRDGYYDVLVNHNKVFDPQHIATLLPSEFTNF